MKSSKILERLIWLLYTLSAGGGFLIVMLSGIPQSSDGTMIAVGAAAGLLLLAGLIVLSVRKLVQDREAGENKQEKKVVVIAERVLLALGLAGMFAVRTAMVSGVAENSFFETAAVLAGQQAFYSGHGGVDMYLGLLHMVLFFFGNKAAAAAGLQIALQMAAGILLYLAVRRLYGPVAALITLAFWGFSPYLVQENMLLSPLPLFLAVMGLTLWMITGLGKRKAPAVTVLHCLLTGLLSGLCCYLDFAGVTAILFLLWIVVTDGEKKILSGGLCLVSGVLGFLGIQAAAGLVAGRDIRQAFDIWIREFGTGYFQMPAVMDSRGASADVLLLMYLLVIGIFSFFYSSMRRSYGMWLFAALALIVLQCFGMAGGEPVNSFALLYLFGVVLAGNAVGVLFAAKPSEAMAEKAEESGEIKEIDAADDPDGTGEDGPAAEEIKETIKEKKAKKKGAEEMKIKKEKKGKKEKLAEQPAARETKAEKSVGEENQKQIHYIENPLPLPKKSVRKALDYDYEVSDDDDYDIR